MTDFPEGAELTPIALGVSCDGYRDGEPCESDFHGDFLGHTAMTKEQRLGMVLHHVEKELGWEVLSVSETYCPDCKARRQRRATALDELCGDGLELTDGDT